MSYPVSPTPYPILECHQTDYAKKYLDDLFGWQGIGSIIARYVADAKFFDHAAWQKYWGVDIDPEEEDFNPQEEIRYLPEFDRFYGVYHGPNPIDLWENKMKREDEPDRPVRKVFEMCFIPTIVPKQVKINGKAQAYNLRLLEKLAKKPKSGHPGSYTGLPSDTEPPNAKLETCLTKEIDQTHVAILLNVVVARNQTWSEQGQYLTDLRTVHSNYGCEIEPEASSQNTVLMAHHAVTGELPFHLSSSGIEGCPTLARTAEVVEEHLISGNFQDSTTPSTLLIEDDDLAKDDIGVAVIWNVEVMRQKIRLN